MHVSADLNVPVRTVPRTPEPVLPAAPAPLPELHEAAQAIRADCLLAPDEYLNETRVPFGGE